MEPISRSRVRILPQRGPPDDFAEDVLIEMANLDEQDTNIPGTLFVSTALGAHGPRVKWYPDKAGANPTLPHRLGRPRPEGPRRLPALRGIPDRGAAHHGLGAPEPRCAARFLEQRRILEPARGLSLPGRAPAAAEVAPARIRSRPEPLEHHLVGVARGPVPLVLAAHRPGHHGQAAESRQRCVAAQGRSSTHQDRKSGRVSPRCRRSERAAARRRGTSSRRRVVLVVSATMPRGIPGAISRRAATMPGSKDFSATGPSWAETTSTTRRVSARSPE